MSIAGTTATAARPATARVATRATDSYRADIDGLRAVAVLAVVFTHAGVAGFGGGFLGVDVFFVISGYLITRTLETASQTGWRGLRAFYARRMRRTLPALYLVAAATFAAASLLLLPGEFDALARSLLAALLFVPNILLLNQAGYFDQAALAKPLLHTWSLGVEEQFYLLAPLLPYGLRRIGPARRKAVLLGLFALALAGCLALHAAAPAAAFYLLPARLWEFLAGCLVAEAVFPPLRTRWLAEAVAGVALLGLAVAIVTFSAATAHPGLPTLLPVLATAALIQIGGTHATLAGRLLGALAGIGLISYSLYLWHWPFLAMARTIGWPLTPTVQVIAGGALLAVSALSWRFVETPFRAPTSPLRHDAAKLLSAAAGGLAMACAVVLLGRGLPQRFPPDVAAVASFYDYVERRQFREGTCFITSKYGDAAYFRSDICLHRAADRPNLLILGDSHAAHLWVGFDQVFSGMNVMQATASGCKPLLNPTGKRYCTDLIRDILQRELPSNPVDMVVLSAAWDAADAALIAETVAAVRPYTKQVLVVGRVPRHEVALPTLLARSLLRRDDQLVAAQQSAYPFEIDRLFKQALPSNTYVSLTDALCPARRCLVYAAPGIPLQFDTDHLTTEGSVLVARSIARADVLDPAAPTKAGP